MLMKAEQRSSGKKINKGQIQYDEKQPSAEENRRGFYLLGDPSCH